MANIYKLLNGANLCKGHRTSEGPRATCVSSRLDYIKFSIGNRWLGAEKSKFKHTTTNYRNNKSVQPNLPSWGIKGARVICFHKHALSVIGATGWPVA